jgi:PIN domain nuclease of toxin-antitoxin system
MAVLLDTHAVIWYLLGSENLPASVYELIEKGSRDGSPALISVISLVEVIYLVERGRVPDLAYTKLIDQLEKGAGSLSVVDLDADVVDTIRKIPRDRVPDMPDRIIAATALHLGVPLITRDRRLQSAGIKTIW